MTKLSHDQIQQSLHIGEARLAAAERSAVAAHLADCQACRTYADQLAALQPALIRALRKRPVTDRESSTFSTTHIQQRYRRAAMRHRIWLVGGSLIAVIAIAIGLLIARIPAVQSTGAIALTPTMTPTSTPTVTPQPTASPTPTPAPADGSATKTGADRFEPNDDFGEATPIDLGVEYDQLNFAQLDSAIAGDSSWDNDFFKVQVKARQPVTCRTFNLSAGADTNLILYDEYRSGIEGNDDVDRAAGNKSSSVTTFPTYDTWLYILVGEGFHRPPDEAARATYSLECSQGE